MDDEKEYKLKRERNNESVKKCRMNEKKKIETATAKLEEFKKENKMLEDKYSGLQKELNILKSLFLQSAGSEINDKSKQISEKTPDKT
jgi:archaellum component FlaC